ncbi:MAG: hybrid sensor histidine kinase/response regulator [Chromatiales bacterium]
MSALLTSDVIEILQQELQEMAGRLRAGVEGDDAKPVSMRALDDFAVHLERFAEVTRALDLPALRPLVLLVRDNLARWINTPVGLTRETTGLLVEWPLAVCRYLSQPADGSGIRGLLDHMRHPLWARPLGQEECETLAVTLADVQVHEAPPQRAPAEINAESLSLEIPADVSPQLLDALLHELPELTERLAALVDEWADEPSRGDALHEAQRVAHTIKGAANTVGVRGVALFTHGYEDLLDMLASLPRPVTATEMHLLRRGAECLLQMSDNLLGRSQRPADVADLLREITDQVSLLAECAPSPSGEPSAAASVPAAESVAVRAVPPALRVPAPLIDEIFGLAGESAVAVTQMRDHLRRTREAARRVERQIDVVESLAEDMVHLLREVQDAAPAAVSVGVEHPNHGVDVDTPGILGHRLREAIADVQELCRDTREQASSLQDILAGHERLQQEIHGKLRRCRMLPAGEVVARLQRGVKQAGRLIGRDVELHITGSETLIDSHILNAVAEPLMHALRNAIDHGIEPEAERLALGKPLRGRLRVSFLHQGQEVIVRCEDDGRGLDYAAIRRTAVARGLLDAEAQANEEQLTSLILQPGFSTHSRATQTSGRGMGMSSIAAQIGYLKGSVRVTSRPHEGCGVEFRLPDSTVSISGVLVPLHGQPVGVAGRGLERIVLIDSAHIHEEHGARHCDLDGDRYPVSTLTEVLYGPSLSVPERLSGQATALVIRDAELSCIVLVEQILAARSLTVKSPGAYLNGMRGLMGTTILGDGRVVPVLDLPDLLRRPACWRPNPDLDSAARSQTHPTPLILIVENSLSAAHALCETLENAGYQTEVVADGPEALEKLRQSAPAAMLVDYDLPTTSGLELVARTRADPSYQHLPMILVTAHVSVIDAEHARLAGADALLAKPCPRHALLAQLQVLLQKEHPSPTNALAMADSPEPIS